MINFTFNGEPVPCVRVTRKTLWTPQAKRYGQYKKDLALSLRAAYPGMDAINEPVTFNAVYYRSNKRRIDLDNLIKATLDAVQDAGLLADDSLVVEIHAGKEVDKEAPRVRFELVRVEA